MESQEELRVKFLLMKRSERLFLERVEERKKLLQKIKNGKLYQKYVDAGYDSIEEPNPIDDVSRTKWMNTTQDSTGAI